MKKTLLIFFIVSLFGLTISAQTLPKLGKGPVKKVVAAMTLEEKATLAVGAAMRMSGNRQQQTDAPPVPVVGQTMDLVAGAAGTTYAINRLGIPQMVVADGPAGLRISPTRQNDQNTY